MKRLIVALLLAAGTAFAADEAPRESMLVNLTPPPPPPPVLSKPLAPGFSAMPKDAIPAGFRTHGPGLPLPEFLKLTLGDIARKPYVLTQDAAASNAVIAADLSRMKDPKAIVAVVREALTGSNLVLREVEGVLFVERSGIAPAASGELFVYTPKHRSVGALSTYFSLFPSLKFTFSAGIAVRSATSESPTLPGQGLGSGATTFSATNADPSVLVVRGPEADVAAFREFLAQVDTPLPEIMLRAWVIEVRETDTRDSAFSLVLDLLRSDLKFEASSSTLKGDSLRLTLPNVQLAVSKLVGDSRVRLVSSPVLRAADGSTASASIGTETPTLGAIVSQNGSTQQSVSYQQSGVILRVSPRVFEDSIRLNIEQELSSFVKTDTGLEGTPTKLRRSFRSDVVARPGEALLLGGLSETSESAAKSSGWFATSKASAASDSQIVVLLQVDRL